eukprot:gene15273-16849_t
MANIHDAGSLDSSSEDSGHDYEDPAEDILKNSLPMARYVSLRRGSMPVCNPDAYLESDDEELNSTYQDPSEAFAAIPSFGKGISTVSEDLGDLEDEPLYQVYNADLLSQMKSTSSDEGNVAEHEEDIFSEYSTSDIESGQRVLWCNLSSVRISGILENIDPRERKRQEAMFEVITSEASYLKSLNILINLFMNEFIIKPDATPEDRLLDKQQFHFLFGGLTTIKAVSENNENSAFCDKLGKLESSPKSQGLSMQSFLMLPMQRITRMPLLLDAICRHCEPGSDECCQTNNALVAVQNVVRNCNDGARKMERIEEMYFIQKMLSFKIKPIPIVSSSRWLLRRGELACVETEKKMKSPFRTLLRGGKYFRIYLFLFTDLLLVTKMKGTEKIRWMDAVQPKQKAEDGEKIYEEWDCPQVRAIHSYQSDQPDELTLREGEVIKVLRKLPDGWYEGVRLYNEEQGWFPANHTEEIHSEHTRARNLMQRYRLLNNVTLAMSKGLQ